MLFVASTTFVGAQPWLKCIKTPNPTFLEIKNAAETYFRDGAGKGNKVAYKTWKRWEYAHQNRLMPDGRIASPTLSAIAAKAYLSTHADGNSKYALFGTTGKPSGNWVNLGPTWAHDSNYVAGQGNGRLNCIAFHPTDPKTFWVGAPAGGLWKTTDGGKTWSTTTDTLPVLGISSIVVDYSNPAVIYTATGDADGAGGGEGDTKGIGVFKSTDGGKTFNPTGLVATQSNPIYIFRLVMNPKNNRTLFAASDSGLYKTTDAGATWTNVAPGYNGYYDLVYKPGDTTTLYATCTSSSASTPAYVITKSTDGGNNWSTTYTGLPSFVTRACLAVSPNSPNLVEVIADSGSAVLGGLWRSTNSGSSFTQYLDATQPYKNYLGFTTDGSDYAGQAFYTLSFIINPANYKEKWIGGVNTWHTTDNGATWNIVSQWSADTANSTPPRLDLPVTHADKHAFGYNPLTPNTLYECNDGGIVTSADNGKTWTNLSTGLSISEIYKVSVAQYRSNFVLIGLQDCGTRGMQGNTWFDIDGGDGTQCLIDNSHRDIIYTGYPQGQFSRDSFPNNPVNLYDNYSQNYVAGNIPATSTESGAWVAPLIMDSTNTNTLFVAYDRVFKSTNGGYTWKSLSKVLSSYPFNAMAVANSNNANIWAGGQSDTVFYTTNSTTWKKIACSKITGDVTNFNVVSGIAIHPSSVKEVWLTFGGYTSGIKVFKTINGGTSWVNMSGTLPNLPVNCITFTHGAADTVYIGTDMGIFYRDASMSDWSLYNTNLPHVPVKDLQINYFDRTLYAGTFGRGLWSSPLYSTMLLPISIGSFVAAQDASNILLKWNTATESNTSHFIIQHSTDGVHFTYLGKIDAIGSGANNYCFTDMSPINGTNYYRLQSVDKSGATTYSKVIAISLMNQELVIKTYPNPAKNKITINSTHISNVQVIDNRGNVISSIALKDATSPTLSVDGLQAGAYHLRIQTTDGKTSTVEFVKE